MANRYWAALCASIGLWVVQSSAQADCRGLATTRFADTEITKAEPVASGAFIPPEDGWGPSSMFQELPAFCRVVGIVRPTTASDIGFELWLPERWNGKYLQTGNGGFSGGITYGGLVAGLRNGFAVASTDDGHTVDSYIQNFFRADWALGHPERIIDYGYRAVHVTSVTAKLIASAYYNRRFSRAYFSGCSNGGREALMEAQRYPDDFDGFVVGAPANNLTGVMTHMLKVSKTLSALQKPLASSQIEAMSQAALARCDTADGVEDGLIEEPLQCRFDLTELQCHEGGDGRCLSRNQLEAVQSIYDDARDIRTKASLTPGLQGTRGAELAEWPRWVTELSNKFTTNFWPFMVYADPKLDFRKLDLLRAHLDGRTQTGMILNSVDPDLSAVRAAGKKIIQFHGWADVPIPAQYSIAYYEAVEKYLRSDNRDFYRLFMVPGMHHCGGGPGPNSFGTPYDGRYRQFDSESHILAALVRWVEKGEAPERIVATKYQDDDPAKAAIRTRPLCVYPSVARWIGKGSTDEARNFICVDGNRVSQ